MRVKRLALLATVLIGAATTPRDSFGNLGQDRSRAYQGAVAYLKTHGAAIGWEGDAAQSVLLAEAIAAYPAVAGPRSASLLASINLASLDARGRRAATLGPLGPLGFVIGADREAVLVELRRPWPGTGRGFGQIGTRVPSSLDDALALQGLATPGGSYSGADANAVLSALTYLAAYQKQPGQPEAGAWPRIDRGDTVGSGNSGSAADIAVTAQATLAIAAWSGVVNVPGVLPNAAAYLKSVNPSGASERALRVLALLSADPGAPETAAAVSDLASMCSSIPCGYDDSVYATALAARALLRASSFQALAFDADGDEIADGSDPDADGDGFCDPGEGGAGCPTDDYPLEASEHADRDHDGIGDVADLDDDGDGVLDSLETAYATNALESRDSDQDEVPDTGDIDDDQDSVTDVEERLTGLDPLDRDTDNDSFSDGAEVVGGTGLDPTRYPKPDGDVYPLGDPDGIVDLRDALLAIRVSTGAVTVSSGQHTFFDRHADVAPFDGVIPQPNQEFDVSDALVILRRATGEIAAW